MKTKTRRYNVTRIVYDLDNSNSLNELDLPPNISINVPDDIQDADSLQDYIADRISDITGFCIFSFNYKRLN